MLAACAVAVAAVVAFQGALPYFFAQDDFEGLARARGVLPRLEGPWRIIGNQLYYDVMRVVAGLDPRLYHAASLALHAATSLLLYALLRARAGVAAALVAATFFAAHPALFTALYWIAATSAILSFGLALGAAWLERRVGPARWLAVPVFVVALAAKETALLLPLALAVGRLVDRRPLRDPVLLALGGVAVAWGIGVALAGVTSAGAASNDAAYRLALGGHVVANLLTYAGWSVASWAPLVRGFADAVDPAAIPFGFAACALWIAGLFVPALRSRGWLEGGAWFFALIGPLALLPHHTYHYYLYGPLAGVAMALAAGIDAAVPRLAAPARALAATLAAAAITVNGVVLVRTIERAPFLEGLRADPTVDRALIAGNVHASLARERPPAGAELLFWSPTAFQVEQRVHPGADPSVETYWERNVRTALLDGLGVHVLFPEIDTVRFVRALEPGGERTWYAVYRIDGSLALARHGFLDSLTRARDPASP